MLHRIGGELCDDQRERRRLLRPDRADPPDLLGAHLDLAVGQLRRPRAMDGRARRVHGQPQAAIDHLIEVDRLLRSLQQRFVHQRDGRDPCASPPREPPRASSDFIRRDCILSSAATGLQVVLHPVVDLADGRVLGDQLTFTTAQLGHIAHQDHCAGAATPLGQRDGPQREGPAPGLHVGAPRRATHQHQWQGLVDGRARLQHLGGQLGEGDALHRRRRCRSGGRRSSALGEAHCDDCRRRRARPHRRRRGARRAGAGSGRPRSGTHRLSSMRSSRLPEVVMMDLVGGGTHASVTGISAASTARVRPFLRTGTSRPVASRPSRSMVSRLTVGLGAVQQARGSRSPCPRPARSRRDPRSSTVDPVAGRQWATAWAPSRVWIHSTRSDRRRSETRFQSPTRCCSQSASFSERPRLSVRNLDRLGM